MIHRILLAVLAVALALSLQSMPAVAGGSYLWKGDEVYGGGVCPDLDTLTRLAEIYVRSIDEGNAGWTEAIRSGECFKLDPPGMFLLGDLMGVWTAADGDVVEVWMLLGPAGSVYSPLYGAFARGNGGGHDTPYAPSDDLEDLGIGLEAAPIGWEV